MRRSKYKKSINQRIATVVKTCAGQGWGFELIDTLIGGSRDLEGLLLVKGTDKKKRFGIRHNIS